MHRRGIVADLSLQGLDAVGQLLQVYITVQIRSFLGEQKYSF